MYDARSVRQGMAQRGRNTNNEHAARCIDAIARQESITPYPYFSKVVFSAIRAAAPGASSYTIARGTKVQAFSYGVGKSMNSAGWLNGETATDADTNLIEGFETNSGDSVLIYGIAVQPLPACGFIPAASAVGTTPRERMCDARLLGALAEAVSVKLSYNGGRQSYQLGVIPMLPGAGGIAGGASDTAGQVALAGSPHSLEFPTNGMPSRSNFFRVPEGVWWNKKGEADSVLSIDFEAERAIQIFTGGDFDNNEADVAASNDPAVVATGTQGYVYPSELVCGLEVFLIGTVVGPRTMVA